MIDFKPNPSIPFNLLTQCPAYRKSPLLKLSIGKNYAVLAKDETQRMGLGSFKTLGGTYAVARLILEKQQAVLDRPTTFEDLHSEETKEFANTLTFVCASAGNHGLAVAAGARIFGARSRVYLSRSVPKIFLTRLKEQSADIIQVGESYEESMQAAKADAHQPNTILLSDSSWPGYTHPPSLVMEGYTVLAEELREAFSHNGQWPTHVFVQAGVGGLAAAISHMIRKNWAVQPDIIIVEPDNATCLHESAKTGCITTVNAPASNMGRLDCKQASLIAHETLKKADVRYMSVSDHDASKATALLLQHNIRTTTSGAAGLAALMNTSSLHRSNANPLIILTEGAL